MTRSMNLRLSIIAILFSLVPICSTLVASPAYALSMHYVAADAPKSCILPDGNPGQNNVSGSTGELGSNLQTCCPAGHTGALECFYAKYMNPLVQLLAAVVGIAIVIAIVYGAIEYITSGGDPQRAAAGKKRITEAIIGLVAFLLLYTFLQFIVPGGFLNGGA